MTRPTKVLRLLLPLAVLAAAPALRPDAALAQQSTPKLAEAVFAGGCYWGVESVFRHVRGVVTATSGYALPVPAQGSAYAPRAEAVRVAYDPRQVTYRQLLDVFFSVVHDPTQLNRQGPDVGSEYRSIVFVDGERRRAMVRVYIDSLTAAHVFLRPIVTEIAALRGFQVVDDSQQDYAAKHPTESYIVINDVPKVEALRRRFPELYRN